MESPHKKLSSSAKLSQDIATLINNRQGSDVQFKVGGYGTSAQGNGEKIYRESATVTFYAHSLILRCRSPYFAAMLDQDRDWKKNSECVIYKPEISPTTFRAVLRYIYTGSGSTNTEKEYMFFEYLDVVELIMVADEMGLEELAAEYQANYMRTIKNIFFDGYDESMDHTSINEAIRTHILPVLNLEGSHSISNLRQELLTIMLPHISIIIKSPDAYTEFFSGILSQSLLKIISSDNLVMAENRVWNLVLSWACHQVELSETAVEARLNNLDGNEEAMITSVQLGQLKQILAPLLPAIRFSLLNHEDYNYITNILNYFLPRRRYLEINQFFSSPSDTRLLDAPRSRVTKKNPPIKIANELILNLLGKKILRTDGISGCHSLDDLKFKLLFRTSMHGFLASTFHELCNNKGPTLVLVKSTDGYLFGGVNFSHWTSDGKHSSSTLNFLFALPDGCHRENLVTFRVEDRSKAMYTSCNYPHWGPYFGGGSDLAISDSADTQISYSSLPYSYNGNGASDTALAGGRKFMVSDYEVFAISKKSG